MTLTYEQMRQMEKTHQCAQCGGALVTIWDSELLNHALVCGPDHSHQGYRKLPTATQALARGQMDDLAGAGTQKDLEQLAERQWERFNLMPKHDIETGQQLTKAHMVMLIKFAESVGLNAYLGHVALYYGQPRISIDGYYFLAKKKGRNLGVLALPATVEERKQYKLPDEDYIFLARAWENGKQLPEIGIGIVRNDELSEMSKKRPDQKRHPIVSKFPERMAEKRAEWQLLRKILPLEEEET